jgi:hypothetical protein
VVPSIPLEEAQKVKKRTSSGGGSSGISDGNSPTTAGESAESTPHLIDSSPMQMKFDKQKQKLLIEKISDVEDLAVSSA